MTPPFRTHPSHREQVRVLVQGGKPKSLFGAEELFVEGDMELDEVGRAGGGPKSAPTPSKRPPQGKVRGGVEKNFFDKSRLLLFGKQL